MYIYIYISLKVSWAPDFRVLDHMSVFAKTHFYFAMFVVSFIDPNKIMICLS